VRVVRVPRTARTALFGALVVAILLALTWLAVYHVALVQRVDAAIYDGFGGLRGRPHVSRVATLIADLCDPRPYLLLCALPLIVASIRRRWLIAAGIVTILAGANLTTEILKPLLAAPRSAGLPVGQVLSASWPSGHATAAMALALCSVLAAPGRLRPYVAALGATFAVAVSYSFLTLGWHYPSDALGGFLVASLWTLIVIAMIATAYDRRGMSVPAVGRVTLEALTPAAVALGAALLVSVIALVVKTGPVLGYAREHTSFVVGAAALGALGLSLATGVMMTLRR
jgi:membrane-associated phospholipid phosphatase